MGDPPPSQPPTIRLFRPTLATETSICPPLHLLAIHSFRTPRYIIIPFLLRHSFFEHLFSACSHISVQRRQHNPPPNPTEMARRQHLTLTVLLVFFGFLTFTWFMSSGSQSAADNYAAANFPVDSTESLKQQANSGWSPGEVDFGLGDNILKGGAIAPRLGNETAKYACSSSAHPHSILPSVAHVTDRSSPPATGASSATPRGSSSTR